MQRMHTPAGQVNHYHLIVRQGHKRKHGVISRADLCPSRINQRVNRQHSIIVRYNKTGLNIDRRDTHHTQAISAAM